MQFWDGVHLSGQVNRCRIGTSDMNELLLQDGVTAQIDLVRELRVRQWARQNFVPQQQRKATWHPVVLDEMQNRDRELAGFELVETN